MLVSEIILSEKLNVSVAKIDIRLTTHQTGAYGSGYIYMYIAMDREAMCSVHKHQVKVGFV